MAEFQPKKEYGIRAEEYPYHGTKLHGHKSYGALEFNLAAEYPMIERAKREKKKRRTVPHMAAAAMAVATVVLTAAAAAPQSTPAPKPVSQAAYTAPAELPTQPEPTLSPPYTARCCPGSPCPQLYCPDGTESQLHGTGRAPVCLRLRRGIHRVHPDDGPYAGDYPRGRGNLPGHRADRGRALQRMRRNSGAPGGDGEAAPYVKEKMGRLPNLHDPGLHFRAFLHGLR